MSVVSKTFGLKRENFALKSANQKQVLGLTTIGLSPRFRLSPLTGSEHIFQERNLKILKRSTHT